MILRLLLLAILVFLLVRFLVRLGRLAAASMSTGMAPGGGPPPVALVACSRCGVFVPRQSASEAGSDAVLCRACAGR